MRSRSTPWFAGAAIVTLGLTALVSGPMRRTSQRKVIHSVVEQAAWKPQELGELIGDVRGLTYWIDRDIAAAESEDWAHPSAARQAVIARWGKFLRPYNEGLLEVALQDSGNLSEPVRRLLCYTLPDEALASGLRRQLHAIPPRALAAARLLHEHRMLSSGDLRELAVMLGKIEEPGLREGIAISLTEFGMPQGIEAAKERLVRPLDPLDLDASVSAALRVVEVAENLGPQAAALIPALEAKIAEARAHAPHYAGEFRYALSLVKGETPLPERIAVNGSGYLDAPRNPAP
jgi:hypothetical protein